MNEDDRKPVGELGAAFAELTTDMPESSFTAWSVMGEVRQRRARRRTVAIGIAATAAGLAVLTPLIMFISGSGSSSSTTAATASSSVVSTTKSFAAAAAPSASSAGSSTSVSSAASSASGAVGQGAPKPDAQVGESPGAAAAAGGSDVASASGCAIQALSAAQDQLVRADLTGWLPADRLCPSDLTTGVISGSVYTANGSPSVPQVTVSISDQPVDFCPRPSPSGGAPVADSSCADLVGHPGVRSASDPTGTVVVLSAGGRAVVISTELGSDNPVDAPFSADQLATLAEALLSTL